MNLQTPVQIFPFSDPVETRNQIRLKEFVSNGRVGTAISVQTWRRLCGITKMKNTFGSFCAKTSTTIVRESQAAGHPILLGETDSVSPPPHLEINFLVTCDDCGKEYNYNPRELLRHQTEPPAFFATHPLLRQLTTPRSRNKHRALSHPSPSKLIPAILRSAGQSSVFALANRSVSMNTRRARGERSSYG